MAKNTNGRARRITKTVKVAKPKKSSRMLTKLWTYGGRTPTQGLDLLRQQHRLAHQYYNRLIQICRDESDAYRVARAKFYPEYEAKDQRRKGLSAQVKQCDDDLARAKSHATEPGSVDVDAVKERKKTLSDELTVVEGQLGRIRAQIHRAHQPANDARRKRIIAEYARMTKQKLDRDGNLADLDAKADNHAKNRARKMVLGQMVDEKQWPELWRAALRSSVAAHEKRRLARERCGVTSGTYLLIEAAMKAALKAKREGRVKGDLKFRRWDGCGRIGVQLQGCVTVEDVFRGRSTLVHIDPLPTGTWTRTTKAGVVHTGKHGLDTRSGRRNAWTVARMRVTGTGKNGKGGKPVWVEMPILVHREIPRGEVKWAWIQITRIGLRTRYDLYLTLKSGAFPRRAVPTTGMVAIDIGWRNMPDGSTRVGYSIDDKGVERDYRVDDREVFSILPGTASLVDALRYPEHLRSTGDKYFVWVCDKLGEWLKEHMATRQMLDAHLAEEDTKWQTERNERRRLGGDPEEPITVRTVLQCLSSWKAHGKLARLVAWWRDQVFPNRIDVGKLWRAWKTARLGTKQDLFCDPKDVAAWLGERGVVDAIRSMVVWCEWWRRKDAHLAQWEGNQRRKSHLRRRELYRHWALEIAKSYNVVIVENFDMRKVVKRPAPEAEADGGNNATGRQLVSPSQFRNTILEVVGTRRSSKDDPADSTRCCTACGHVDDQIDARSSAIVRCPKCGREEDQDRRAAINMLRWHCGGRSGEAAERAKRRAKDRAAKKRAQEENDEGPDV